MTKLYLAIPCYNEEEVLRDSAQKLSDKFSKMMLEGKITDDSKIVFIDDGSKDKNLEYYQRPSQRKILYFRESNSHATEDIKMLCSAVLSL